MIALLVATVPATIASLGAWLAARGAPAKLIRIEAALDNMLDWQTQHERRHKLIEGDSR